MTDYEIIMIFMSFLTVMLTFGNLVVSMLAQAGNSKSSSSKKKKKKAKK